MCVMKSLGRQGPAPVCEGCKATHGKRQITWTGSDCARNLRGQGPEPAQPSSAQSDHEFCVKADKIASHCKCDPGNEMETCTDDEMCVELKLYHDHGESVALKCLFCGDTTNIKEVWIGKNCRQKKDNEKKIKEAMERERERQTSVAVDRTEENIAPDLKNDFTAPACEESPGKRPGEDCLTFEYIENRIIEKMKKLGYDIAGETIRGLDATGGAVIEGGGKVLNGMVTIAPYVVNGLDAAGAALIIGGTSLAKGAAAAAPYVRDGAAVAGKLAAKGTIAAAPIAAAGFSAIGEGAIGAASLAARGVVFITPHALNAALAGAEKLGDAAVAGAKAAASVAGKAFTPTAGTTDTSNLDVIGYLYDKASGVVKYALESYNSLRGQTSPSLLVLQPKDSDEYRDSTITQPCEFLEPTNQHLGQNCLPANVILWRRHSKHVEEANRSRARFQGKTR